MKEGLDIHKHQYDEITNLNDFKHLDENIGEILDDVGDIWLHEGSWKVIYIYIYIYIYIIWAKKTLRTDSKE